jgi:DNA-binding MarR family transcriptional regulator
MKEKRDVLNNLLVVLFNNVLTIEERALKRGAFKALTLSELHVIEAIGLEQPTHMTQVANRLGVTIGTLTIAINNLVSKGYVTRKRAESDRRVVNIALTDLGHKAFKHHEAFHDDMISDITASLSDEESNILVEALSKVTVYFEEKYNTSKS